MCPPGEGRTLKGVVNRSQGHEANFAHFTIFLRSSFAVLGLVLNLKGKMSPRK